MWGWSKNEYAWLQSDGGRRPTVVKGISPDRGLLVGRLDITPMQHVRVHNPTQLKRMTIDEWLDYGTGGKA